MHESIEAALDWVMAAWHATGKRGLSAGYDLFRREWKPAYPETTGYTIPTLFDCAQVTGDDTYRQVAVALAEYELAVQTTEGAILCLTGEPIAFDTGQVIFGWMRAWREVGDVRYLRAAQRAADWLAQNQSPDGAWREHQYLNVVKVIDTRVAWSLLQVDEASEPSCYRESARRNLDWAVAQQRVNGWFDHCALRAGALPTTHTLAYTIEGLLESGILLGEDRYIQAARKTADILLGLQRADGFLGGEFDSQWKPSAWSCLTGKVQMALVWFRLYDITNDANYLRGARAAIDFVRQRQNLKSRNPGVRGGIPGSSPIWGPYERFKYPNWAVKFFIDALLAEDRYRTRAKTNPPSGFPAQ
jgi:hypothetical protein